MAFYRVTACSILVVLLANQITPSNGLWWYVQRCYVQRCIECTEAELAEWGTASECDLSTIPSNQWLEPGDVPNVTVIPLPPNQPWSCVKIRSNSTAADGRPHQSRGCMPSYLENAQQLCDAIFSGHGITTGRSVACTVCRGNLCNSAAASGPLLSLLAAIAVIKMAITMFS